MPVASDRFGEAPTEVPRELPVLPVREHVIFPGTVVPVTIGREKSKRLIDDVLAGNRMLATFAQRHAETEDPGIEDVYRVGTAAQVLKLLQSPDGSHTLLVHGITRVGLEDFLSTDPYWVAAVNPHADAAQITIEVEALMYNARAAAEQIIELSPNVPDEALGILRNIETPGPLGDFLAANLSLGLVQKQELLETFDVGDRLRKVNAILQNQLEILQLARKLQSDVREEIDNTQRRYYLQEQLKAIRKELGEDDGSAAALEELRKRINDADMPDDVRTEAERELTRLARMSQASPDYGQIRDYLDWLLEMPWRTETEDQLDLHRAEEILNADHHGLERVKRRILEYLAVRKLNPAGRSPILCFVGPPGVGKTSLGQSIARALGRKFIRIALGGVRDEADIRGHRRTYIGAIPGRLVREIRKSGTRNPLIMLDELDKLGADFRGDPAAALLEVLDREQNYTFTDHYLGLPFDLSSVFFIATANYMDPVAPALRDRMEVIHLPGYTVQDKLAIAKRYLVGRQIADSGLADVALDFTDSALLRIIDGYTREAGVRNLERTISTVCRGIAAKHAREEIIKRRIDPDDLREYLGPPRFEHDLALQRAVPGVATGLAYTPVGGEIIFVEVALMPGRGAFTLTGQIGDVMRESAQAALSLIRSNVDRWGLPKDLLSQQDIHIHVPAGAIPKDGPSAGVAMLTALFTALTDTTADPSVGMTGEITLRGLVLPIGGVKEKVLAAQRAGLKTVVLPARNEPDLEDVPRETREALQFVFAERIEQVLSAAIGEVEAAPDVERAEPRGRSTRKPARKTTSNKKAAGATKGKSRKKASATRRKATNDEIPGAAVKQRKAAKPAAKTAASSRRTRAARG